ncbi:electron transfer flavoprotein subunit alpha/FixB family protein [Cytophagaceae bacterium ABcell3]|nr:electron transfer flavoprotein subunit alpha/FixB family protein [Cytophagaceae bacterium ABcell3]
MAILVYVEGSEGEIKKSSLEAVSYAAALAKNLNTDVTALVMGSLPADQVELAGKYGASVVLHASDAKLDQAQGEPYASVITAAAEKAGADIVLMAKSSLADSMAGRVAAKLKAGLVTNVVDLPSTDGGFKVKKSIFTGKAFVHAEVKSDKKVLTVSKNAFPASETGGQANVETFEPQLDDSVFRVKVTNTEKASGDILLTEADIVVSGGRGLKGPENWNLVEDLAKALGAATGCSKPVSDLDWRPHHEHVGQTGVKVAPNLYIALGISGAIQHLAGVNSSKVIVVINKDPEAPFFKAADYGIVGDVFDVVPKLTEAVKALR